MVTHKDHDAPSCTIEASVREDAATAEGRTDMLPRWQHFTALRGTMLWDLILWDPDEGISSSVAGDRG